MVKVSETKGHAVQLCLLYFIMPFWFLEEEQQQDIAPVLHDINPGEIVCLSNFDYFFFNLQCCSSKDKKKYLEVVFKEHVNSTKYNL